MIDMSHKIGIDSSKFEKADGNLIYIKILNFLKENSKRAFTAKEISEGIACKYASVSVQLNYLNRLNKVTHKRPYWMFKKINDAE